MALPERQRPWKKEILTTAIHLIGIFLKQCLINIFQQIKSLRRIIILLDAQASQEEMVVTN